ENEIGEGEDDERGFHRLEETISPNYLQSGVTVERTERAVGSIRLCIGSRGASSPGSRLCFLKFDSAPSENTHVFH
ncbi:MAG TPA: hypothetical protein VN519_10280, partial [Bryobacteraceae bacterium]|nr:hypothetical protein [Bryobacteraceae bacterium]